MLRDSAPRAEPGGFGAHLGQPLCLPKGLGVSTGARQGLQSLGPGPVPPVPQNLLAAPSLGLLPPPLGSVSSRGLRLGLWRCTSRGCARLGGGSQSPRLGFGSSSSARGGGCLWCPRPPPEASALFSHVGLGLSLGCWLASPGTLTPPNSTEVQQCSLTVFNLTGSRIFIPEFDPVCHVGWEQDTLSTSAISMGLCGPRGSEVPSCTRVSLQWRETVDSGSCWLPRPQSATVSGSD